jgi:hypothetical protein
MYKRKPDSDQPYQRRDSRPERFDRDRTERTERTDRTPTDRTDRNPADRKNKFGSVNNTIVISNIPNDINSIDTLNSCFKLFGNVINIQVKYNQGKALVQFAKREDAMKALNSSLSSPFDSPNIKVSWAKKFDRQDKPEEPVLPPQPPKPDPSTYQAPIATVTTSTSHRAIFNNSASVVKKEEAKKQVKERSSTSIEESKQQLDKAKKLLLSLDAAKNIDPQEKASLMKKIAELTDSIHTSIAKESTVLEKVKGKIFFKLKVDFF